VNSGAILDRGLPANLDAERAVLGAVLLDNAAYTAVAEVLVPEDFSADAHRRIFARMVALAETARPIDPVTLTDELLRTGELEAAGGVAYFSVLTESLPRSVNAAHYAEIVKERAQRRRLIHVSNSILRQALADGDSTPEIIDRAEQSILAVGEDANRASGIWLREIVGAVSLDSLMQQGRCITGVATGFTRFDDLTCGLQPAELIIVAGRPSMGKTAWALSVAANVARRGEAVQLFSLEMTKEALFNRLLCAEARVDSHKFRSGFLAREDMVRISQAAGRLATMPIYIDDSSTLRLQELHAKARRLKREHDVRLVIVDYLGLMTMPKGENRNQQVSALTRGLKAIAKELRVPLVALAQLSRAPEGRTAGEGGHRPQLADLRDSGSQEQDADLVAFVYRQDYYLRMMGREVPDDLAGRAEVIVAKQRNGPIGNVHLAFLDRFARFENLAECA
jgi:replicative DNA helicase